MRVKELSRWLDSFGLPQAPWAVDPADWATGLNLLARLLHPTLAKRVENQRRKQAEAGEETSEREEEEQDEGEGNKLEQYGEEGDKGEGVEEDHQQLLIRRPSQMHPSTELPLQEAMELAERILGAPQFVVVADLKCGTAENQLALFVSLCAIHFALGQTDTKAYRDFQFAFRIYFDMDSDGSRRECAGCGNLVHLIERLVLDGQVWHRSCLKCALCGRQLYRGAFHLFTCPSDGGSMRLECVEHGANALLFGDPKHRLAALPLSAGSMSTSMHSPQSSQPGKRASLASLGQSQPSSPPPRPPPPRISVAPAQKMMCQPEKEDEESIEMKIASAAAACHDAPVPRPRQSLLRQNFKQPEKTSWEVLEYPEELNPFGSDAEEDEADEEEEENGQKEDKARQKQQAREPETNNPFESDSDGEEGRLAQHHGQPMVHLGNNGGQGRMLPVERPGERAANFSSASPSASSPAQMVQLARNTQPCPAAPSLYPKVLSVDCAEAERLVQHQQQVQQLYVPPLGPMPFRLGLEKQQPAVQTRVDQHQLQQLHELDTKLRRLHAQLDQWEITGARLEGQMLRELAQKENQVWRRSNKLANEFGQLVGQRCAALAMEGLLVRRYMDAFLGLAHAELDRQMKERRDCTEEKMGQFNHLLAQLLHIRNELTELERRETEARTALATGREAKETKKERKEKEKQEEKPRKEEKPRTEAEGGIRGKQTEQKQKEEKGGSGGTRLLKNTLKNLKKKL